MEPERRNRVAGKQPKRTSRDQETPGQTEPVPVTPVRSPDRQTDAQGPIAEMRCSVKWLWWVMQYQSPTHDLASHEKNCGTDRPVPYSDSEPVRRSLNLFLSSQASLGCRQVLAGDRAAATKS